MIWIEKLPIPPSANEMYETNVYKKRKFSKKTGREYMGVGTSKRKSDVLIHFQLLCTSFKNQHLNQIKIIREQCLGWISKGYVLRVDTWFAFEHSRLWTKDGQPQMLDADNRRKALQDGLANILDIDDKWIFSGMIEKVTCDSKEYEQCVIKIIPVKCRTLTEIRHQRTMVDS